MATITKELNSVARRAALDGPPAATKLDRNEKTCSSGVIWRRFHPATSFGGNVLLTMGTNVLVAIAGLVTGPLSARLLGPAGRGELAAIQNLYWLVATLAMLGMPEAALYFTAREQEKSGRILSSAVVLVLLVSPVFLLATYHFVPFLLAAQSSNVIRTARWYLLGIPLYSLTAIPLFVLRGKNDLFRWNVLRAFPAVGWLLLLVIAPLILRPTPQVIAIGYLCLLAVVLLPTLIVIRRRISGSFLPEPKSWLTMLRYGIPLAGATIPLTLNLRLDQMLMAGLLPATSLGLYVVAVSWSGAVTPLLVAIGMVSFPRVAGADPDQRGTLLAQATRLSVILAIVLAVLTSVITPLAIPLLFGRAFSPSVPVGIVLVFAAAISGLNVVCEEGLRGLGESAGVFWGEAIGLLITATSLALLLPRLGIMGAGIASILGYVATSSVLLARIRRSTGRAMSELLVFRVDDLKPVFQKTLALSRSTHLGHS